MIHYIYEGDIYIANMTQQLTIESKKAPQDVFYNLRKNNPSPFGGYLDFDHYQIVCASPERFLKLTDGHVETRPIKGEKPKKRICVCERNWKTLKKIKVNFL